MSTSGQIRLKKKLLIISQWAPPMVGGPQNLYNLFYFVRPVDYAIISSYRNINHSGKVFGTALPCKYFYYDQPESQLEQPPIEHGKFTKILLRTPFLSYFISYYASLIIQVFRFTRKTVKLLKDTDYELLIGISDSGISIITTYFTHLITKKPFGVFFFDLYKGNNLTGLYRLAANFLEPRIFSRAKFIIVTNEATKEHYEKKYSKSLPFHVIYNASLNKPTITTIIPVEAKPKRIVFTGNVGWPQEQSLLNLVAAMEQLKDLEVELDLYIPKPAPVLIDIAAKNPRIHLTSAPQDEMSRIQSSATLLFLPLAWDTKAPEIIATATPGKFTDYLASGRPMLVHAPDYAYISTYTKEHNLGLVVDTNSVDALATTIRNFLANPEQGKTYVENALKVFVANHEASKNATKLTELLNLLD